MEQFPFKHFLPSELVVNVVDTNDVGHVLALEAFLAVDGFLPLPACARTTLLEHVTNEVNDTRMSFVELIETSIHITRREFRNIVPSVQLSLTFP